MVFGEEQLEDNMPPQKLSSWQANSNYSLTKKDREKERDGEKKQTTDF